jgi:hypothetical protein
VHHHRGHRRFYAAQVNAYLSTLRHRIVNHCVTGIVLVGVARLAVISAQVVVCTG